MMNSRWLLACQWLTVTATFCRWCCVVLFTFLSFQNGLTQKPTADMFPILKVIDKISLYALYQILQIYTVHTIHVVKLKPLLLLTLYNIIYIKYCIFHSIELPSIGPLCSIYCGLISIMAMKRNTIESVRPIYLSATYWKGAKYPTHCQQLLCTVYSIINYWNRKSKLSNHTS